MASRRLVRGDYKALVELRFQMRQFLSFGEHAAREAGIEAQQQQALLAVKGLPEGERATIKTLAQRLCIKHHSAVALVDKLEDARLLERARSRADGREVLLHITRAGERMLERLTSKHRHQLSVLGPSVVEALARALGERPAAARHSRPAARQAPPRTKRAR